MYKVCTCPQSNLTGGDPNCPIHGHPPATVTRSWCTACAEKDERIRQLIDTMVNLLKSSDVSWYTGKHGGHDWREAVDEAHLLLVKIDRRAKEGKVMLCHHGQDRESCVYCHYEDTVDRPDSNAEVPCSNPSCASLHERIRGLEEEMARTKYWMKAYLIPRKYGHHPEVSIMDLWKEKELRRKAREGKDE